MVVQNIINGGGITMNKNKNTLEELDNQIQKLRDKLDNLEAKRDGIYAGNLYNLVGRYFKSADPDVFEIFKVKEICRFDRLYTIRCVYLKHFIGDYGIDDYFVYDKVYDISLYNNVEDSVDNFNRDYKEITKEEFNSLLKESFNTYSRQFSNETI